MNFHTSSQSSPFFNAFMRAGPWIVFALLGGLLLEVTLSGLPLEARGAVRAGFGVLCALAFWGWSRNRPDNRYAALIILLTLAVFTIAGGAGAFQMDLSRSYAFAGVVGLLAGSVASGMANHSLHKPYSFFLILVHMGILVILAGAAADTATGRQGFLVLRNGDTASEFAETYGGQDYPTGHLLPLPVPLAIEDLRVEMFPPPLLLKHFTDETLERTWEVRKGLRFQVAGRTFRVKDFELQGREISVAVPDEEADSIIAAVFVSVKDEKNSVNGWLFSQKGDSGLLRDPEGKLLVQLTHEPSATDFPQPVLQVDAAEGLWRFVKQEEGKWRPLPDFLQLEHDGISITVTDFIPSANRLRDVAAGDGGGPLVALKVGGDQEVIILSSEQTDRIDLGNGESLTIETGVSRPKSYEAKIRLDHAENVKTIRVNEPLSLKSCRLYLADIRASSPDVAVMLVNCGYGFTIVKAGFLFVLAGLLGMGMGCFRWKERGLC